MQLVMKVEHCVLRQDTGEISPGRGRGGEGNERRRNLRVLGGGAGEWFRFT